MNIVITGASRGIGRFLADRLKGTIISLEHGECDVSNEAEVHSLFDRLNHVDVLINNAGAVFNSLVTDMSGNEWDYVVDTNLKGTFLCSKYAIPKMSAGSHIINISSVLSRTGCVGACNYAASKGGVESFTKSLALELIRDGIFVNCISLGFFDIGLGERLSPKAKDRAMERIPSHQFGDPEEIARTIEYIIGSKYLVGSIINLSGGYV